MTDTLQPVAKIPQVEILPTEILVDSRMLRSLTEHGSGSFRSWATEQIESLLELEK